MDNSINGINTKDWNCLLGLLVCTHCKVESDTEKHREIQKIIFKIEKNIMSNRYQSFLSLRLML